MTLAPLSGGGNSANVVPRYVRFVDSFPLAANEYRLEFQMAPTRFTGRMRLEIAASTVGGAMTIEQPQLIDGTIAGKANGPKLELRFPYTMRRDGCVGDVIMTLTFNASRDAAAAERRGLFRRR